MTGPEQHANTEAFKQWALAEDRPDADWVITRKHARELVALAARAALAIAGEWHRARPGRQRVERAHKARADQRAGAVPTSLRELERVDALDKLHHFGRVENRRNVGEARYLSSCQRNTPSVGHAPGGCCLAGALLSLFAGLTLLRASDGTGRRQPLTWRRRHDGSVLRSDILNAPGGPRTHDYRLSRPVLCPTEVRGRCEPRGRGPLFTGALSQSGLGYLSGITAPSLGSLSITSSSPWFAGNTYWPLPTRRPSPLTSQRRLAAASKPVADVNQPRASISARISASVHKPGRSFTMTRTASRPRGASGSAGAACPLPFPLPFGSDAACSAPIHSTNSAKPSSPSSFASCTMRVSRSARRVASSASCASRCKTVMRSTSLHEDPCRDMLGTGPIVIAAGRLTVGWDPDWLPRRSKAAA